MSDKAPTPWGHGGSGAPEGDDWVWASSPTDPETGYPEEDMRLFHAPKAVAAEVVRAVNAYAALVEENKRLKARADAAEKQRDSLRFAADGFIAAVKDAAAHARRPRGGQQVSFHGDFANIQPSALGRLEWWARTFEDVGNFDYAVTYLTAQLNEAQAEVAKLRAVIKQVDELADTQPSYWVVSLIKATQSVLKRGP